MRRVAGMCVVALLSAAGFETRAQCPDNDPNVTGTWHTLPYQMPINPISATLLHDGRILIVAGSENDAWNDHPGEHTYRAAIWDPNGADASSVVVHQLGYDVFCSGPAQLPHGRILIVGGTGDYSFTGEARATFFDPATGEFAQSQTMTDGRWYATATALGDGRIMAISGLNGMGATSNRIEIFDLNTGAGWGAPITATFTPSLFPRTFLLPDGRVWYSGHAGGTSNGRGYFFDPVAKTFANSAPTTGNRGYGTVVLLPLLPPSYVPRFIAMGGGPNPAKSSTELIDLSATTPAWSPGPSMSTGRIELNANILPNGRLLVHGGSLNNESPDGPGKQAEIYDPATNSFSPAGMASYSRLYHFTSLLLPDARVVSMGSNPGSRGRYLGAIEMYTPPYLYDANDQLITTGRPAITSAPTAPLLYNAAFSVSYSSSSPIASAVLVRPGSTTHAFDMEQRLVGLCGASPQPPCAGSGGTLDLTTPLDGKKAPPGFYMLFLLDAAGVPSHAAWIELTPYSGPPPDGTITTPPVNVTITAGQSVTFGTTTSAARYSWVFSGGSPATSTAQNPGTVTFSGPGEYSAVLTVGSANGDSDPSPSTRKIRVLPASADFELTVDPPSRTILPGQSATFTVTVTPLKGFTGTVTLTAGSEATIPTGVSIEGFSPQTIASGSGSSTLTVNTTTAAVPYALSLTVHGVSGTLTADAATTLLVHFVPPEGIQAAPSTGQVGLSWLPSVGANGYAIRRGTSPGGGPESLACTPLTSFTDTEVTSGETYYYDVVATYTGGPNAGGASAPSSAIEGTPPCPTPTYSGALGGSNSSGDVVWSWSAGGASAYDLVRGDLAILRATGGDFEAAIDGCLANDTSLLSLVDPDAVPSGEGIFTLLRPAATDCPAHGSLDDGSVTQIQTRDLEVAAAPLSCP